VIEAQAERQPHAQVRVAVAVDVGLLSQCNRMLRAPPAHRASPLRSDSVASSFQTHMHPRVGSWSWCDAGARRREDAPDRCTRSVRGADMKWMGRVGANDGAARQAQTCAVPLAAALSSASASTPSASASKSARAAGAGEGDGGRGTAETGCYAPATAIRTQICKTDSRWEVRRCSGGDTAATI
jgi:hypothetical protein